LDKITIIAALLTRQRTSPESILDVPVKVMLTVKCCRYRANTSAFDKYVLRPRVLVDVSQVDTSTELFGRRIPFPLGISPSMSHLVYHPEPDYIRRF
jgi:isopentenyl diphosphate isomerase/L-lactate dehydrogenase-like FMN-dependent dehydrogenase